MAKGLPYKGSKNGIAKWIMSYLPPAKHFYDLFAGGCAVTHAALLSGHYEEIAANDITDSVQLFMDAINGKYRDEKRWISREDFFRLKDSNPYVRICWSFGNNLIDYIYAKEIIPYKKALHYAIVLGDTSLLQSFGDVDDKRGGLESLERLHRLQSLEGLHRLQSLEGLHRLQSLSVSVGDYQSVPIEQDSVIYCDPPYHNTDGYLGKFNHERFYEWCRKQKELTVISEYEMPGDFYCIAAKEKNVLICGGGKGVTTVEKLFIPMHQKDLWERVKPIQSLWDF